MINFCEITDDELFAIIDFFGYTEIIQKSLDMKQRLQQGKIIEKSWEYYDEIIVTPSEIFIRPELGSKCSILNIEKFSKLSKLINKEITVPIDDKFIFNICLSYRHDFGLLNKEEQEKIIFEAKEWIRAINNNLNISGKTK